MVKDGTYWAEQIRKKKVSSSELIKLTTKKIRDSKLNAVIEFDEEKALQEISSRKSVGEGPFNGVPIALKMLGQVKEGMGNTSGSRLFENEQGHYTDNFVLSLEKAGFIPFGKTNTPEFGFKNITDPTLYGPTKNAWNQKYHAGGSSGGAASAVASGIYPVAAASDGGGSIRIPASFSGLIGLKPTRGSIPVGPNGWRGWQGASINFALTVSMRDTEQMFESLRCHQKAAPFQSPSYETLASRRKGPMKIACCLESPIGGKVTADAKTAFYQGMKSLVNAGHKVVEVEYPVDGRRLIESYYKMNGAETVAMMWEIEKGLERKLDKSDMEPMTWAIYQFGRKLSAGEYSQGLGIWDEAAATMETLFEEYDAFLSPTTGSVAPLLSQDLQSDTIRKKLGVAEILDKEALEKIVFDMFYKSLEISPYTQLANLTGQPAISLPTYVSADGMPLGIQLMSSKGREDILFQIGREFESKELLLLPEFYRK